MAPLGKHRQSTGVPRPMKTSSSFERGEDKGVPSSSSSSARPPVILKLWIIRMLPDAGGVVVEGYRAVSEKDATTLQNWRSTPIAARLDAKTLQTHSGGIYKLKGGIDEDEAAEAGIPEDLIEAFECGFPENWKELVDDHLKQLQRATAQRRKSMATTLMKGEVGDEEEENAPKGKKAASRFEEPTKEGEEEEERMREAKQRRSLQKGRKSMLHRVQPGTPIEEEEEEVEEGEKKTPARKSKTPARPSKKAEERMEMDEEEPAAVAAKKQQATAATAAKAGEEKEPTTSRRTPRRGAGQKKKEEEEEVFATPDETPRTKKAKESEGPGKGRAKSVTTVATLQQVQQQQQKGGEKGAGPARGGTARRRASLEDIPREILEKSIPLTRWVIRFVRGGTASSIFPHFQFKCCGFRPECTESEWTTSAIQKVVPPYMMFTSSSIYRLDGHLDVDQAAEMGFPPHFISDFLMGFPDDWEERLEVFFNKTFGPPPQPKIVEVTSDGGATDEVKPAEKKAAKKDIGTPKAAEAEKARPISPLPFEEGDEERRMDKRKAPSPDSAASSSSSSSSSDGGTSSSGEEEDEEEQILRAAKRLEKEMRREQRQAAREAEARARSKEEKKKRFEVRVKTTPEGVPVSRSGRTLRTPMATWAGENVTYDARGNVIELRGVTTTTKMTVGRTSNQTELLAAHYGVESPLDKKTTQQERALAPPKSQQRTPAPPQKRRSKDVNTGYSDEETERMYFQKYAEMLKSQADATPAFNVRPGKRKFRVVESSDSEAEEAERRKEEKRKRREERRRLRESEEEEESSDDGWRKKKKQKKKTIAKGGKKTAAAPKKTTVKKEKASREAPGKKRKSAKKRRDDESEEEESESEGGGQRDHSDDDAITFVMSEGSVGGGRGYSSDEIALSDEEETRPKQVKRKSGGGNKKMEKEKEKEKERVKKAKAWKKEELIRLKLAIQAADPSASSDGWETVARSLGGDRTAEECKKIARERLNLPVAAEPVLDDTDDDEASDGAGGWSGAESGAASEDDEKKQRRKAKMDDGNRVKGVTAKKGTVQYAIEMEQKKREMMKSGTASQDDCFKDMTMRREGEEALPSVAVFDPDDSLLECLDEDAVKVVEAPKQRQTKTAKMAAAPATPALSSFDDSPAAGSSSRRSALRSSAKFIPSPVINQNDLTRYVHQLSRSKNISMLSKSVADRSRMLPPPVPRGRNVARAAEAIEKVERSLRHGRKAAMDSLDDLDEDEENNDNVLPAGF